MTCRWHPVSIAVTFYVVCDKRKPSTDRTLTRLKELYSDKFKDNECKQNECVLSTNNILISKTLLVN